MQSQATVSVVENNQTPTEKILAKSQANLMEFTDSQGRIIKLKEPDALDYYDFFRALGKDGEVQGCAALANTLIHIESINGEKFIKPNSQSEIRAALQRLNKTVYEVNLKLQELSAVKNEEEAKEELKK